MSSALILSSLSSVFYLHTSIRNAAVLWNHRTVNLFFFLFFISEKNFSQKNFCLVFSFFSALRVNLLLYFFFVRELALNFFLTMVIKYDLDRHLVVTWKDGLRKKKDVWQKRKWENENDLKREKFLVLIINLFLFLSLISPLFSFQIE